jgi:hypothetical protein
MRTLSSTLTAAQKSSSARPHPKVEVFEKIGGITRLSWTRLYEGSESDSFHACCMPGDGSLIRMRTDASNNLYRHRVTSPDVGSDFSSWTSWGVTAYAVALCSYGSKVFAFRIGTDGKLYRSGSTDYGASWGSWIDMGNISGDATFRLAASIKDADHALLLYSNGSTLYRILGPDPWGAAAAWTNSMNLINGVAVTYMGDLNIVVTGKQDTTLRPIVCTCVLGDGYSAAVGNWSSLKELTIAETDSDIAFKFPTLDMPDVFRAFFVEAYSGKESYNRPYWTHSLATADFIDNLWREPVPFNLSSDYGLAMCHKSPLIWLTRPDGVWRASVSAGSVEITDSVLQIEAETNETSGRITIVLRNDDGRFANIGQSGDTYEAIKLGSEIKFSPGYHTTAGLSPEHSTGLAHWITGWEYTSHGGHAEFILHAVDGWGLLEEWKARRQFSWASGDKNIFQLLNFIFARAGLEFSSFSSSSAITAQYPTFTIYPRASGKTTVLRLLAMVEDVLFFRGHYGYLKHPQTSDSTDYTYGTDHAIHEGIYRQYVKQVNRAQAFGDSVFTEDWDWDEVELVWDKLAQAYDMNLDTTAKAHQRGDAMLREAAIRAISGHIIVPLNCGQELYDVVEITDSRAGLNSAKRRILGLNHHYVPAKGIYSLTAILGTV